MSYLQMKEKEKMNQLEILGDILEENASATIRLRALDFGCFVSVPHPWSRDIADSMQRCSRMIT